MLVLTPRDRLHSSTLTYRLLNSIDGLLVSGCVGIRPNPADVIDNLALEVLLVDQHVHGEHDLSDEDHEQDGGIGHGHAVRLPDGSAASEEGDQEDDASEDDQEDGGECGIILLECTLQVARVGQANGSE